VFPPGQQTSVCSLSPTASSKLKFAVRAKVDLREDIVPALDLGEQLMIDLAAFEHFREQVKAMNVRLKAT
jgi:hypothetical protein